jgi:hypothetical protein
MPVTFGATAFGVTAPSGYLQESSRETTLELATIKDAEGKVEVVMPKPRRTVTTVVKSKGEVDLDVPQEGSMSGATITGSKVTESNDDFAVSETTYTTLL